NQANPLAHYKTTGPEIWEQTDGALDVFLAGVGTGGTITGTGRFLKEKNPRVKVIGADPEGSMYHHEFYGAGGSVHTYLVEGIGEDFMPSTLDMGVIDDIVIVSDKDALLTARKLAKQEGILVGGSAGAAVHAALEVAEDMKEDELLVVLLPDTGRNYLSKVFNDDWMRKTGLLEEDEEECLV
ncbi:MAG: PLP-dependent cysteine synthase family protein, partial [Candidatus Thorarchaeota archaeon]